MPEIDPKHTLRVYVEFLKIPEDQCPPNYYTLLAVSKTAQDTTSIEKAAKRRSEELRRGLPTELLLAGRKILKRIARARICLLDVDAKAAYDASIGLTARVDQPSKAKAKTASVRKSAQVAHNAPPSSPAPQPPSQRRTPPSRKPSPIQSPPQMDEFDDLLSELPDIEPTLASLPPITETVLKPELAERKRPTKSRVVIFSIAGSALLLVVVIVSLVLPSAPPDTEESTPVEKAAAAIVVDSEEVPEIQERNIEQKQPVIPKLPLAERIKGDTRNAEYSISGGTLTVSLGMSIPYDNPVPIYVAGTEPSDGGSVSLTFNGESVDGGYFNVAGRPVAPRIYVDNPSVLRWKPFLGSLSDKHDHHYTSVHTCVFLAPGEANLLIHFDGQEIRLPFLVTKIALPERFGKKELIDLLGFPDNKETGYVSWPNGMVLDGEFYEAKAGDGGVSWDHWYYSEYPTLAFVPNRSTIRHIFPKQELAVDQSSPQPRVESTAPTETDSNSIEPLPTEIALPNLRGPDSTLSEKEEAPVDLGAIGNFKLDKLQLTLDQPAVEKGGGAVRFEIARSAEAEDKPSWEIRLRSAPKEETDEKSVLDDVGSGLNELVGKIHVEDSRLKFVWASSEHMSLADQLRNCVLCFEDASKSHRMALRSCTLIEPILIDFTEATRVIKLEQESLPPIDSLFLGITSLEHFSVSVEQQPTDGIIEVNDTLKIRLTDWPKPAEFRVRFSGSRKKLSVVISAHYRLGSKWQRMTVEEVDGGLQGVEKALARSRHDLREAQSAVSRLPSQINSLASQLRNDSGNAARIQSQLLTARRQLSKAKGMGRRATKQIPKLEADILLLKSLASLGNRLHQRARIQFRIVVKMEKDNIDLLRTSDDANKVEDKELHE